jgi:hypothetical protein
MALRLLKGNSKFCKGQYARSQAIFQQGSGGGLDKLKREDRRLVPQDSPC